jgi:hypothetical protein
MTESKPGEPKRRVQARLALTTLELRLYVVALLAVVYVLAWRAIAPAVEAAHTATVEPVVERAVERPSTRADRTRAAPSETSRVTSPPPSRARQQPPRVVRVPARRVRTRSS